MAKVRQDVGTIVSQQEKIVSNREKGVRNVKPDTFFTDEMGDFWYYENHGDFIIY